MPGDPVIRSPIEFLGLRRWTKLRQNALKLGRIFAYILYPSVHQSLEFSILFWGSRPDPVSRVWACLYIFENCWKLKKKLWTPWSAFQANLKVGDKSSYFFLLGLPPRLSCSSPPCAPAKCFVDDSCTAAAAVDLQRQAAWQQQRTVGHQAAWQQQRTAGHQTVQHSRQSGNKTGLQMFAHWN